MKKFNDKPIAMITVLPVSLQIYFTYVVWTDTWLFDVYLWSYYGLACLHVYKQVFNRCDS